MRAYSDSSGQSGDEITVAAPPLVLYKIEIVKLSKLQPTVVYMMHVYVI